jgi:hypothetical protein
VTVADNNISADTGKLSRRNAKNAVRVQVHKGGTVVKKRGHVSGKRAAKDLRMQEIRLARKRELAALRKRRSLAKRAVAQAEEVNGIQPGSVLNQPAEPVTATANVPTNRWRGYVASIDGKYALIRLSTEAAEDEHELRVPVDEVAVLGSQPLEAAMPVMLTQGRETRSGRPRRTITLEARPVAAWTPEEAAEIQDEAHERALLLRDDDT